MKKVFGVLVAAAVMSCWAAFAADLTETVNGACNTVADATRQPLQATGRAVVLPLEGVKFIVNSISQGMSGGETFFWD